jgi:hypothetical protein
MTDKLIQAAEMALEALETLDVGGSYKTHSAASALRQALAEPQNSTTDVVEREPVAWGMQNADGQITDVITPEEHDRVEGAYTIPLYTAPLDVRKNRITEEKNHG